MSRRGREAYYNEFDPMAAAWLRHLIEEGLIANGVVDQRSIKEVEASDLRGFAQCHFFAGVGVWSYALRQAGWADDEPIWTGSCPCQPFSAAGRQLGFSDARHLWPDWLRLISECRPERVIGEQVASAGAWLDLVSTDMEARDYAFAAVDLPAAGFAGAHIRQRFYWVADAHGGNASAEGLQRSGQHGQLAADGGAALWLGDTQDAIGRAEQQESGTGCWRPRSGGAGAAGGLDDPFSTRLSDAELGIVRRPGWGPEWRAAQQSGGSQGAGVDWLLCRDSRWRPVEPGACPLVVEASGRMGRLRGYGNALDAETATNFIAAYMAASDDLLYGDIA